MLVFSWPSLPPGRRTCGTSLRRSRAWSSPTAGDARAQAWLGYLYEKGIGVPQNAEKAVYWYHCAADRGQPHAQFLLGMAHDLGRGAPQDYVLAYAWTNQAVARAQGQLRRDWVRIRHSIASKLSLKEKTDAQRLTIDDLRGPDCRAANIVKGG